MLDLFLPAHAKRVIVYLEPISMGWGTKKLGSVCRNVLKIEPDLSTAFLFTNKKRDCLLLYSIDERGDRTLTKKLEKGAFLLPAPGDDGQPFVIMKPKMLSRLFRS